MKSFLSIRKGIILFLIYNYCIAFEAFAMDEIPSGVFCAYCNLAYKTNSELIYGIYQIKIISSHNEDKEIAL